MTKRRNFEPGYYFHSYSRGVNKDIIFRDHLDYLKFQDLIERFNCKESQRELRRNNFNKTKIVDIYCFTLMPNHFHILLKERVSGGISKFLQKILSQYAMYYNNKYDRIGPLFQSRFKDKLVDSDQYFNYLVVYIWNNPIKIIKSKYKSIDLFHRRIKLSKREKDFAKNYPYKKFHKNFSVSSELTLEPDQEYSLDFK